MSNDNIISDEQRRAQELLGAAEPTTKPAMKNKLMHFSSGPIYMDLRTVSEYDKVLQDYKTPVPKIVLLVNNKFVGLPFDSEILKEFGSFVRDVGEAIEGVRIQGPQMSVEEAREKMRKLGMVFE